MFYNSKNTDELMLAICDFVSRLVDHPAEIVHERFMQEICGSSQNCSCPEFGASEGVAIEERTVELMSPFVDCRRKAQDYLEQTLKDGWARCNGKSLLDVFLFASELLSGGHVAQQRIIEEDDICPLCGSDKYVLFDDGTANCVDCRPGDEEITKDEVEEIVADLEAEGLVEWTGEYRPTRDGTLEKVYRATQKRVLH